MKLLFKFIKPYRKLLVVILIFVLLDVAGALLIPTITADMINVALNGGDIDQIIQKGIIMLVVSIATGIGALYGSWLCAKLSSKIGQDIRNAVYDQSLTFSSSDFEKFGSGSMMTRTLNDVTVIQQSVAMCIQMIIPVPLMCALGVGLAFNINHTMGFLLLGVMFFMILAATILVKKSSWIFEKMQLFLDKINVVLRENITGVRVVRAFNRQNYEQDRMNKTFTDYADSAIRVNRLFAILDSFSMLIINLCIVAILWLGGNRVGAGAMKIGDITALTEYAILILQYIIMAQMVLTLLPRAATCLQRISEILTFTPEIIDTPHAIEISNNCDDASEIMRFENATFRFDDADEDTLNNLSFSCHKGKTTAIIGGTGSGKSTVGKLILRYHDVISGHIYLKNHDIQTITQHELRENISYVPQKAWLFSGTIADNLRYGNTAASDEEIYHALDVAQADFVYSLPKGIYAPVAQGGINFSGGQKQRLSIARALIKKSELYIFDDSFSALDFKTDAALRKALKKEMKDPAMLIIAQRINTIINADQIIVVDHGKIVDIGIHTHLMKNCTIYQNIAKSQMKGGDFIGK